MSSGARIRLSKWFVVGALVVACIDGQSLPPVITNVTNAAIPALDSPPNSAHLAPRSIASIFGANLASATVSTTPPWKKTLGGTEVHLVTNLCNVPNDPSCEFVADLIYVSPTQINFLVPDLGPATLLGTRIVFVRNGVRVDGRYSSGSPGYFVIDARAIGDYDVVFGVGYECLFSFSLVNPSTCGVAWSEGPNRALLGAITDASGELITSQNPVRQGDVIVVWMTGLLGLSLDAKTGLFQQANPSYLTFGVAQNGKDLTSSSGTGSVGAVGKLQTPRFLWAGESPQFVGLDQVNVNFPVCTSNIRAQTEKRYDAFLSPSSILTTVRVYLPFLIRVGDPECQWLRSTITLTSDPGPSTVGQPVTLTATVLPSTATGTVTFMDGAATLGTGTLSGGRASTSISSLAIGSHSITATYDGDGTYAGSSITRTQTVTKAASSILFLTASPNTSTLGQAVTFSATLLPATVTGTVTFMEGATTLGSGLLAGARASFSTSSLSAGTHSIRAVYSGDAFNEGSTSSILAHAVNKLTTTISVVSSSANPSVQGQQVTFTATVSPSIATGTVTFNVGTVGQISCSGAASVSLNDGQAACTTSSLSGGAGIHSITATYNGDNRYDGSTSPVFTQTVKLRSGVSLTSSVSPSLVGESVTFTAFMGIPNATGTMTFRDGATTIGSSPYNSPQATFSISGLSLGSHSLTAVYSGDSNYGGSTSNILAQWVGRGSTAITLTSAPNPSTKGERVVFTVCGLVPSGIVTNSAATLTLLDGTTELAATSSYGPCFSTSTSVLSVGTHSIVARYSDSAASGLATLVQTVR